MKSFTFFRTIALVAGLMLLAYNGWGQYDGTGTFVRINSVEELEDGYYVVAEANDEYAMNNEHNGTFLARTAITIDDGSINNPELSIVWKIEINEGGRTIYNEAIAKFVSYTGSSNNVQIVDNVSTDNQRWAITFESNVFAFANLQIPARILQYNPGHPRFACYTSNQRKFNLYKLTEIPENQVSAPVFNPTSGNYYEPFDLTISTSTPDAEILYSFDSNNPDEGTWIEYDDDDDKPVVSESTTIWAYATKEGMDPSNVSSASYSFPIDVENITELRTKVGDGNIYRLTGGAVITLQGVQSRNQRFIQDDDAGILIDDNNGILGEYYIGDVLENLIGTVTEFNNMVQLVPAVDLANVVDSDVFPEPIPVSIPDIDDVLQGMLIKVENLTYQGDSGTFAAGQNYVFNDSDDNSITLRTIFADLDYIGDPIPVLPQDIVGVHGIHFSTFQITPRSWDDFTELEVEDPLLFVNPITLSGFTYIVDEGPSEEQSFNVRGLNLVNDITITAPDNFEILTTAKTGFTNEITLYEIGGTVSETLIQVRLVEGLDVGVYTGTITINSDNVDPRFVSLSGEVTEPPVTEVPFTTDFGVADYWTDLPPTGWTGYNPKAYEDGGWYFHSTEAVRGTADESFDDAAYSFRDRGDFTINNLLDLSGMTGFSLQLRDWMEGTGVTRTINVSLDGGDTWDEVGVIDKAWFDEYQVYQPFIHYFSHPHDADAGDLIIEMVGGVTGTNNSRINIGQFKALDDDPPPPPVAAPVFDPPGDDFPEAVWVVITTETEDASIFYRFNTGEEWTEYTDELNISETTTILAYAAKDGMTDSPIATAIYNIIEPATTSLPYSETFDEDLGDCYVYSVSGDTRFWVWNEDGWAQMNGHNSGDIEEDWLILPGINFDNYQNEAITFDSWFRYGEDDEDNYLKLLYSSDYAGVGNPGTATWTGLAFNQPEEEQEWAASGTIDLTHISGTSVYLAFKYRYEPGKYRRWQIDNILIRELEEEPSEHVTNFTAATNTSSSIIVSWTDADAEAYLVKGSTIGFDDIEAPVDGVPEADNLLVKNLPAGVETHEFTGLEPETEYFFRIFPYNGSGANVNYKTDGDVPEASAITDEEVEWMVITHWPFDDDGDLSSDNAVGQDAQLIGGTTEAEQDDALRVTGFPDQSENSGTAGIELMLSTAGFEHIIMEYKGYSSATMSRWAEIQYTIDGGNEWLALQDNDGGLSPHAEFHDFVFDFGAIPEANDNAEFGIRIVSIFAPVAFEDGLGNEFEANTAYQRSRDSSGNPYSGDGNWRFQDVVVKGIAVPAVMPVKLAITDINGGDPVFTDTPFDVVVQAQDENNIPVDVNTDTEVTLSLETGTGELSGILALTMPAGENTLVFTGITYTVEEEGVSITASTSDGMTLDHATSETFEVLAPATHLAFVDFPVTGIINTKLEPFTVEARRDDQTVDPLFNGLITLSVESRMGTLNGSLEVEAVEGIATFDNLWFDAEGEYSLTAASEGLDAANSDMISIAGGVDGVIVHWNFDLESLDPTFGAGTAENIGGTTYFYAGGVEGSGWNTTSYPEQQTGSGTAGVEFMVSTVGFENIGLSYWHRNSGTSSRFATLQYTIDGINWIDFETYTNGPPHNTFNEYVYDFSAIPGVNNNPDFGVRIVAVFSPEPFTDPLDPFTEWAADEAYQSSRDDGNYATGGTWRFDEVTFFILEPAFPEHINIAGDAPVTIGPNVTECFFAQATITVAGANFDFIVEEGGEVTLVAVERITMLPGTKVLSGGYLHAYLDDENPCLRPFAKEEVYTTADLITHTEVISETDSSIFFRMYPNPSYDQITIEMGNLNDQSNVRVEILNLMGAIVLSRELPAQHQYTFSLADQNPGLYVVRVIQGNQVAVERLIKR